MTVQEAIAQIHAPKGVTSIIAGIMNNDYSVLSIQNGSDSSLKKAQEQVALYQKQLDECKSDWSYWSILGDLTYWEAVRNILEAGTLNNGELAYVSAPELNGIVAMDAIGRVDDFGKEVLRKTILLVKQKPIT